MFAKIILITMKKAFALFAITLLSVGILSARKPDHVSVVSGNVKILGEKETLCSVKFDYSNTQVDEKPLMEYLQEKGDDYVADWDEEATFAQQYFYASFNDENSRGLQVFAFGSEDVYAYEMTIHVNELDMGEGGSMFNPFARRDAGGMKMSGTIEFKDKETGEVVLVLKVDGVKGESHVSQRVRMGLMYDNLAEEIAELN
jgi:hypothetical protein